MDPYERKQAILRMHGYLQEQRALVSSSKKEARKLLTELGIMHLLVPIKKRKSAIAGKPKKAATRKQAKSKSTGK